MTLHDCVIYPQLIGWVQKSTCRWGGTSCSIVNRFQKMCADVRTRTRYRRSYRGGPVQSETL